MSCDSKRSPTPRPGADAVYALTKRAINDLARVSFDLAEHRDRRQEDPRDKAAYDALQDVRDAAGELCVLWDLLWRRIGQGRPDPVLWSSAAYSAIVDEEDLWPARLPAPPGNATGDDVIVVLADEVQP